MLFTGFSGIGCIEAGGPKPGVGCAGRGIITAFELLEKFHIKENYNIILYDVLGDVVCGGFAVPIRREYADTIFLVTSGEYMSLYAANNILRGIRNYDDDQRRVAGILYNSRSVKGEDARVSAFAQAVGLPIFARIPRDDVFARAEKHNCTIPELRAEEDSQAVGRIFAEAASKILAGAGSVPRKASGGRRAGGTDLQLRFPGRKDLRFYGACTFPIRRRFCQCRRRGQRALPSS